MHWFIGYLKCLSVTSLQCLYCVCVCVSVCVCVCVPVEVQPLLKVVTGWKRGDVPHVLTG